VNVGISELTPGVFGVSAGGGATGMIIRDATGSEAGHAFLYLGNGVLVQGQPPKAVLAPADSHADARWAWRMWSALKENDGWTDEQVTAAQGLVVARGRALVGTPYDYGAYVAFTAMILHLRTAQQMSVEFEHDPARVCSGLVADAERTGGVPLNFVPEDGPSLITAPDEKIPVPLVTPGMLLGVALRRDWM
jgi:hypothetical protein